MKGENFSAFLVLGWHLVTFIKELIKMNKVALTGESSQYLVSVGFEFSYNYNFPLKTVPSSILMKLSPPASHSCFKFSVQYQPHVSFINFVTRMCM